MPIVNVPEEFLSLESFKCSTAISLQEYTNFNLFTQHYTNAIELTKSTSLGFREACVTMDDVVR